MTLSPFLTIVDPNAAAPEIQNLALDTKFPLDPFQRHAAAAIQRHENVLVTAKTGSGKTLVGEVQIAESLRAGRRVFYTTPIKSLSNQKFHDLKRLFPDRVGIMTGDIKFRPDADIVIMTTEILRNLLFKAGTATESIGLTASLSLENLDAVIFDECHYINDRDRGAVWEETLILLPPRVNLVLLSATIDAPEQFASWLGDLKQRPIHLISTQYRIVPLVHGVYRGDEFLPIMDRRDIFDGATYNAWLLWRKAQEKSSAAHKDAVADRRRGGYEDGPVRRAGGLKSFVHEMNQMIGRLHDASLLPALFFVFSRKDCERYARLVEHTLIDSSDTAAVKHIIDFHLHRYSAELDTMQQAHTLRGLLEKGVAFHHSGLLPVLKEIVEILFGRGYIKVLFATETFAVGINMPTKTVVFTGFRKYDDSREGMRLLNTDEYIQMAGRAGRRGKDDKGLVLYLPEREPETVDDMKRMMTGAKSTFQSRMTFHYNFLLKTLQASAVGWRWLDIMERSYWYRRHGLVIEAARREVERLRGVVAAAGLTGEEIREMERLEALQEAVKGSVNAARREATRALSVWSNQHVGPRWHRLQKEVWPGYLRASRELAAVERDLEAMLQPQEDVAPTLRALEAFGYLEPGAATLTPLGVMASEVNEGHPILMPLLFRELREAGGKVSRAHGSGEAGGSAAAAFRTQEEVLTTLALFLGESRPETRQPVGSLEVPESVVAVGRQLVELAAKCNRTEVDCRVLSTPSQEYWEVATEWVEPIWAFLGGKGVAEVAAEFGVFEGNFVRVILKVGNLLEEWRALATLSGDVEMLELLRGAEERLRVGAAGADSLYLRLD